MIHSIKLIENFISLSLAYEFKSEKSPAPKMAKIQCIQCGQLILRKISSNIDAIRCQILRLKCTHSIFAGAPPPEPAERAYTALTDRFAVFKGPTSKGRGIRWWGREEGMEVIERSQLQ